MPKLLIVDDEPNVLYSFERALTQEGVEIESVQTGAAAQNAVNTSRPDVIVLDVRLPDMSGLDVFESIRQIDPRIPVIIVTAHSTTETAIDAMKRGAFEYLLKPVDIHELQNLVQKAFEISRTQHVPALFGDKISELTPSERIVGQSKPMQEIYKAIGRVAPENFSVLILGESGTGKELVAKAIYHHSERSQKPFLAINCAALPDNLLESELFGHERGAFTGADRTRIGKFEQANGGTLFLDELGDMSPATQAKVLRVLQDGRFERVGGTEPIQTDVRLIAATNQDLESKIEAGEFRLDLFYRLNGFTIRLPSLRDRMDDLQLLLEHFLQQTVQEVNRAPIKLSDEALKILEAYHWPGNLRELQSVVKYAVIHAVGDVITAECLPEHCRVSQFERLSNDVPNSEFQGVAQLIRQMLISEEPELYRRLLSQIDRVVLHETLKYSDGNQVQASQRLGISRSTLRSKLSNLEHNHNNQTPQ